MAFTLPTFNLVCGLFAGPWPVGASRLTPDCNLAMGRRSQVQYPSLGDPGESSASVYVLLLLPAFTDVRSRVLSNDADFVEVPLGSGRWYRVEWVEDIGKGFDNEHRAAGLLQVSEYLDAFLYPGLFWPVPMP